VEFCFLRAQKPAVAALTLLLTFAVDSNLATAQTTAAQSSQGQAAPGQAAPGQAAQKNYKDRGEYDLYSKATQEVADPKAEIQTLQQWQDKYPQTDFQLERLTLWVRALGALAGSDPAQRQALIDKANQLLKLDPKNFLAGYYTSLWGPAVGGASPPPDLLSEVDSNAHVVIDNADTAFPADKKPANMTADQWAQTKNSAVAVAHNALAWEATQKKDTATAENEYKTSLQANPNDARVSAAYGKLLIDDKKYPEGLFEFARAASYDGPGSLPAAQRQQLTDYFNKAYTDYHGGADGAQDIITQAKTNALPPDGFKIVSANDIATQQANDLNTRIQNDPAFKIWYAIKQNLQDKGDPFFDSDVKEVEIPGGAEGVKDFTGTVISLDPPTGPTKVVLGVEDKTKPDATLVFSQPLPPDALNTIKVGQQIQFSGVADSYTKDPYMLTFKDPTIPGVKTTTPPRTGHARRHR